jgi:hypothetical protein
VSERLIDTTLYREIRHALVANLFDGDESGRVSSPIGELCDDAAEVATLAVFDLLGIGGDVDY